MAAVEGKFGSAPNGIREIPMVGRRFGHWKTVCPMAIPAHIAILLQVAILGRMPAGRRPQAGSRGTGA